VALRIVLTGIAMFVAFNVAMFALSYYAGSSAVGIRERARIRRSIDWYPPVRFMRPRSCGGNEVSAISTLRNVSSSQEQFRAACAVDEDGDGRGEYGTFVEMAGGEPLRGRDDVLSPPVLSGAFKTRTPQGEVSRSGYRFLLRLAAKDGSFVTDTCRGSATGLVDPDAAEAHWRCYAWPATYDVSGLRTFFIDERGDVWATDDERYSGGGSGPAPDAATASPGTLVPETPAARAQFTGGDGNLWTKVN
jgi:hypothetical protein